MFKHHTQERFKPRRSHTTCIVVGASRHPQCAEGTAGGARLRPAARSAQAGRLDAFDATRDYGTTDEVEQGVTVLATVYDPDGRLVELTAERWQHILLWHPILEEHQEDVLRAIGDPSRIEDGNLLNETRYFLDDAIAGQTLKVAVNL